MTRPAFRLPAAANLVAAAALIASFGSLYVAWRQSSLMERQLAASVWPALKLTFNTKSAGSDRAHITLGLRNGGIGPALIRAFDLSYGDAPITTAQELLGHCGAPTSADVVILKTAPVLGNLVAAGERLEFFDLERAIKDGSTLPKLEELRTRLTGHVCYCSALDDCWLLDISETVAAPVKSCSQAARRPQYDTR